MAMTTCKECGKSVSTKASACPSCGAPGKKPLVQPSGGCAGAVALLMAIFMTLAFISWLIN